MKEKYVNIGDLDTVDYQNACKMFKNLSDSDKISQIRLNELSYLKFTSN